MFWNAIRLSLHPTFGTAFVSAIAGVSKAYATKYCSKPEKWFYMDSETSSGLKEWLKCRTVGICMAWNRLMNFHVVRSTKPVQYIPACFVGNPDYRIQRDPGHKLRVRDYPDPDYLLSYTQKYFFRRKDLRHLRIEQFNRYCLMAGEALASTVEDTITDEDAFATEFTHRNYDPWMETVQVGAHFLATQKHVPGCRRRQTTRMGVSRGPTIEPVGQSRENFYESKLVFALPWYCDAPPENGVWTFVADLPSDEELRGGHLEPVTLRVGDVSFEHLCSNLEKAFCCPRLDAICARCFLDVESSTCASCSRGGHFGSRVVFWFVSQLLCFISSFSFELASHL